MLPVALLPLKLPLLKGHICFASYNIGLLKKYTLFYKVHSKAYFLCFAQGTFEGPLSSFFFGRKVVFYWLAATARRTATITAAWS